MLLIGIDGGGSKTDFLLCDGELNELARYYDSRSNPNDIGIENAAALIKRGVNALCGKAEVEPRLVDAAFAGIAGASSGDNAALLGNALRDVLPSAKTLALHDGINVLYGAFPFCDGVSIICGTGSSCFVKKGMDIYRIGGYGAFDLIGNGYEIGRAALAHALRTADGREAEGRLEALLHERFGADFVAALDEMLRLTKNEIAAIAPTVFSAAHSGDQNAVRIINDNMEYIAGMVCRAGDYFGGGYSVALAGGILNDPLAFDLLRRKTDARVQFVKSKLAPSFGAAARAKQLLTDE